MKALCALISLLGTSLLGTASFAATCTDPVPAPKYHVGERFTWRYTNENKYLFPPPEEHRVWEVTGFDGDLAQVKWSDAGMGSSDNEGTYVLDRDWVIRKGVNKKGKAVQSPEIGAFALLGKKVLAFPLEVGKVWNFSYENLSSYRNIRVYSVDLKVVGCETVATPAGKFPSLKIIGDRSNVSGRGLIHQWYSPDAKNIVKLEYGDFSPPDWYYYGRPPGYELMKLERK